jgi:peptidoglycan/xylan/chitin deacetylase (PgdA/CDA1 family)
MKRLIKGALARSGHYQHRLRQLSFPGVAVLCYHGVRGSAQPRGAMPNEALHVTQRELAEHCRLIAETCHPIDLATFTAAAHGGALPRRPVLFTFDDGYRSTLSLALPVLRHYGIPAAIFAVAGPIAEGRLFWFDAVARARGAAAVEEAKQLPYDAFHELVGRHRTPAAADDPCAPLSIAELRSLAAAPDCAIGAHTLEHPILARATLADQRREIAGSRARLEEWLDRPVATFAYPNGRPGIDYTGDTVALLGEERFTAGFTTANGFAGCAEPFEVPRFLMLSGIATAELAHRLAYSWLRPASPS